LRRPAHRKTEKCTPEKIIANCQDEVLAELGPKIRLVVAQQAYDEANGVPATQFPAVAAVLRMQKDPQEFSIVMEEAWQKAIGLVNFTRGQQAETALDSLLAIVGQFRQLGLELRGLAGATQARLSIELKLDEKQAR
jgi:hypothetical protein